MFLFSRASRVELGTTQPPIQWIQADLFLGLNLSVHENHTPPCSAEFKTVNLLSPTYACYDVWCLYLSYVTCFLTIVLSMWICEITCWSITIKVQLMKYHGLYVRRVWGSRRGWKRVRLWICISGENISDKWMYLDTSFVYDACKISYWKFSGLQAHS